MAAPSRSKREHLRGLVEDKNQWSHSLTDAARALGFLGWHERGYLPHCDIPNLIQFVTFRLEDSMPVARRGEWEHLLEIEDVRERRTKLEEYLDRGVGECLLRDAEIAKLVQDALLFFHDDRYELRAWCVMPNHVHVLVDVRMTPLWNLLGSWKHFTQTRANHLLALQLQWQREYWDTFMRDEEQERKAVHYIEHNPVKARLCPVPADWQLSSARFRDEYRRLVMPAKLKTIK